MEDVDVVDKTDSFGRLEHNLTNARLAAQRRQRRLQVPCITAGVLFGCCALVLRGLLAFGHTNLIPTETLAAINACCSFSAVFILLALLPTQERAIRRTTLAYLVAMFVVVLGVIRGDVGDLRKAFDAEAGHLPIWYVRASVVISLSTFIPIGLRFSLKLLLLWLRREPARSHLEAVWRTFGQTSVAFSVRNACWFVFMVVAGVEGPVAWLARLANALGWTIVAVVCLSSKLRNRLQARFAERGESAIAALVVGALLGDRPFPELLRTAREHFRCVSLDRVTKAMIEDCNPNPELHALTERAVLGDVDAFISHSWHDDPDEKWEVLQRWRVDFKRTMGREAKVWFDKFSIDQENIADSLAGLPIYLAGCNQLLVLMGSTYVTRLWCLIELFAFIVMGGDEANLFIEFLPSCKRGWDDLDVRQATCASSDDRSRLLGVIEAGLGSLESFNEQVHALGAKSDTFQQAITTPSRANTPGSSKGGQCHEGIVLHKDCSEWELSDTSSDFSI